MEKQGFFIAGEEFEYVLSQSQLSSTLEYPELSEDVANVFYLDQKHGKEILVPVGLFNSELTPLQTAVKYLKENKNLSNKEISRIVRRDTKTIWITYNRARSKRLPRIRNASLFVPLSIFGEGQFSPMESLVLYLKQHGLNFSEISRLLGRDPRTIWTVHSRILKKMKKEAGDE
jgi:DNA-directed RNA polymerase specialized sigma24 family protein